MSVPESFLNRGDALVLHQPLNKGCVAFVSLTLNPFSLSCNSAFGEATLDVVGVSGAEDDDGGAEDNEEEPGRGGHALSF